MTFTVVASYYDPPSIYCTTVEAESPEDAIEAAWEECMDGNDWEPDETVRSDEWSDVMVIKGAVEVVG